MRILVAPDSFKGSLTAVMVAEGIEMGIHRVLPAVEVIKAPLADGGDGTVEAMVRATDGVFVTRTTMDPLGRPVEARFGLLGGAGDTAIIEVAAASGLTLLQPEERNPLIATTWGTGHLIRSALDLGATRILIGLGGSATVDGGMGLMQALGARFLDAAGEPLGHGGGELRRLQRIDLGGLDPRLSQVQVSALCDVDNPLLGPRGAAAVFGPQKGATEEMVAELDAGLSVLAGRMQDVLGRDVRNLPGAGAAGGLGACLAGFLGAELRPGAQVVMEAIELEEKIAGADLVIVGEGRMDGQTAAGKAPVAVARLAKKAGKPVIALAGGLEKGYEAVYAEGIDAVLPVVPGPMTVEQAMARGYELVFSAAQRAMRLWQACARAGPPDREGRKDP